jgi:ankyrin repeat protein
MNWLATQGVDVNAIDDEGNTALHWAAIYGKMAAVKWLVEQWDVNASSVNRQDNTALLEAQFSKENSHGCGEVIVWLQVVRARDWLRAGIEANDIAIMVRAVEEGASVTAPLGGRASTPLCFAALHGRMQAMQWLVEQGADVNLGDSHHCNPLSFRGRAEIMECRPLCFAAVHGRMQAMQWLVKQGADVNLGYATHCTILHGAAGGGRVAAMKWLVKQGAELHAVDGSGYTALHWAATHGKMAAIEWLVGNGVDPLVRDEDGNTALQVAILRKHADAARWLQKHESSESALLALLAEEEGEAAVQAGGAGAGNGKKKSKKKKNKNKNKKKAQQAQQAEEAEKAEGAEAPTPTDKHNAKQQPLKPPKEQKKGPCKAMSAYIFFSFKARPAIREKVKKENPDFTMVDVMKQCMVEWNALSDADKKPYADSATADKERYQKELAEFEAKEKAQATEGGVEAGSRSKEEARQALLDGIQLSDIAAMVRAVEAGASVTGASVGANSVDFSVLHAAATHGDVKVVQWLVDQGADVNGVSDKNGCTPLHLAACTGHLEVLKWLVEQGADAKAVDAEGNNALHLAAVCGRVAVIEWLVGHGVDISLQNTEGITALQHARGHKHFEAAEWLQKCESSESALLALLAEEGEETAAQADGAGAGSGKKKSKKQKKKMSSNPYTEWLVEHGAGMQKHIEAAPASHARLIATPVPPSVSAWDWLQKHEHERSKSALLSLLAGEEEEEIRAGILKRITASPAAAPAAAQEAYSYTIAKISRGPTDNREM